MSTIIQNTTNLQALLDKVNELPKAGNSDPVLQDKTVTPTTSKQTITADSGYDGLDTVTVNAMPTVTQATPSITVSSAGLITASSTQSAGYVVSGTKSATKQLTTQGAQTITPGTSNKTIASGRYLTGTQTIKGDANLIAGNIKKGVSIFGVAGSYEGSGGGSSETTIQTCTVKIINNYWSSYIGYSALSSDGTIVPYSGYLDNNHYSYTFTDVIVGSMIDLSFDCTLSGNYASELGGLFVTGDCTLTRISSGGGSIL